jgi:hypothetical protein
VVKAISDKTKAGGFHRSYLTFFGFLKDKDLFGNEILLTDFPKHGFMTNGKVYSVPERRTSESGSGLLPTPAAAYYPTPDTEVETSPRYPEAWLDGTWDTIPRVVSGQKHRQARLKCLGNAVVPQIPQLLWGLVKEALWV